MEPRKLLPAVEIAPTGPARSSIVWLHGLGADGHDFEPIVPYLDVPPAASVRFVFPHAPQREVTINLGMLMPAWYDVRTEDLRAEVDEDGIRESVASVHDWIAHEERRGIPAERIVVAGFSQGGAIAAHAALAYPRRLAGLLALSTYIPLPERLEAERTSANAGLAVFQAHGSLDPLVPLARGDAARGWLEERGYAIDWRVYPIAHEVCPPEIIDIGRWLRDRLDVPAAEGEP